MITGIRQERSLLHTWTLTYRHIDWTLEMKKSLNCPGDKVHHSRSIVYSSGSAHLKLKLLQNLLRGRDQVHFSPATFVLLTTDPSMIQTQDI